MLLFDVVVVVVVADDLVVLLVLFIVVIYGLFMNLIKNRIRNETKRNETAVPNSTLMRSLTTT